MRPRRRPVERGGTGTVDVFFPRPRPIFLNSSRAYPRRTTTRRVSFALRRRVAIDPTAFVWRPCRRYAVTRRQPIVVRLSRQDGATAWRVIVSGRYIRFGRLGDVVMDKRSNACSRVRASKKGRDGRAAGLDESRSSRRPRRTRSQWTGAARNGAARKENRSRDRIFLLYLYTVDLLIVFRRCRSFRRNSKHTRNYITYRLFNMTICNRFLRVHRFSRFCSDRETVMGTSLIFARFSSSRVVSRLGGSGVNETDENT